MFPVWYGGGFPDAEKLLESLFAPLLTDVIFVPWLPHPDTQVGGVTYEDQLQSGKAFLRIARVGGRINFDQNRDEPRVQLAAVAKSRQKSWDLIEFCRQIVWVGFGHGALVPNTIHKLQASEEVLGPQLIPENIVEPRMVPASFGLYTWKPRGLSNYRQALGL
jgi:hypothetical protein